MVYHMLQSAIAGQQQVTYPIIVMNELADFFYRNIYVCWCRPIENLIRTNVDLETDTTGSQCSSRNTDDMCSLMRVRLIRRATQF